jgi:hypothetical protein
LDNLRLLECLVVVGCLGKDIDGTVAR